MMKSLLPLLRIQGLIAWRSFRDRLGGGRSKWGLLLIPLAALAFVPIIGGISGMYFLLFLAAGSTGQAHLLLTLALTAGQLVCLMFGIFYVISAFYFSKDLPVLVPLPIRPGEIVLSKFIGILAGEYLTVLPVVLPALVIYGVLSHVSWTYVPFALLIVLLLPVIPLVVSSLFSMLLMRATNMRRNRDVWRVLGGLMGVGLAIGINYISRFGSRGGRFSRDIATRQMQDLLAQQHSLLEAAARWFPTSGWATNALREGAPGLGTGWFLLFTGVAVTALFLLLWVAEKIFYGGLLGGDDTRSSGKVLSREELSRETGFVRSPLWALVQREMRLLNRTPSFLMAAVLPVVLLPVMSFLGLLQAGDLRSLLAKTAGVSNSPLVPAISIAVVLFMNTMSNVGATAVSREGRHFWISRSLPVAPRVQVQAKLLHSLMFTAFNIAIVMGSLAFAGLLRPLTFMYVLLGGFLASVSASSAGILVDLLRPYLKWTDPQQAMKGNMNVVLSLLATLLMVAILAAVTVVLFLFARPLLLPGIILLFGVEAVVLVRWAGALADRRYVQYED